MGNGRPGDHWYSDIVVHGIPTLSGEADKLVIAIAAFDRERGNDALVDLVEAHLHRARQQRIVHGQASAFIEHHLQPDEAKAIEADLRTMHENLHGA